MKRDGRKGEVTGEKKTLYLRHLWNESLKEASKKSGKSQSEIVEWALSHSFEDFRKQFLNEKEVKSDKDVEKILDTEEAFKLSKKELAKYAQETSERRYGQDILYGEHETDFKSFMKAEPQSIWNRILG